MTTTNAVKGLSRPIRLSAACSGHVRVAVPNTCTQNSQLCVNSRRFRYAPAGAHSGGYFASLGRVWPAGSPELVAAVPRPGGAGCSSGNAGIGQDASAVNLAPHDLRAPCRAAARAPGFAQPHHAHPSNAYGCLARCDLCLACVTTRPACAVPPRAPRATSVTSRLAGMRPHQSTAMLVRRSGIPHRQ